VRRSPIIYPKADEKIGKPQLGDRLMKTERPVSLKWGPLPPNELGSTALQEDRRKERKKERKDR
jgi:hypothetical protein